MHFVIPLASTEPIYRQIVEPVRRGVASGRARAGDELPSVRALAELPKKGRLALLEPALADAARQAAQLGLGDLERVVSHVAFMRAGRLQLFAEWDAPGVPVRAGAGPRRVGYAGHARQVIAIGMFRHAARHADIGLLPLTACVVLLADRAWARRDLHVEIGRWPGR